jgi:hypothetical protein
VAKARVIAPATILRFTAMHDLFAIDVPDVGKYPSQAKQNRYTLVLCDIADTIYFARDEVLFRGPADRAREC